MQGSVAQLWIPQRVWNDKHSLCIGSLLYHWYFQFRESKCDFPVLYYWVSSKIKLYLQEFLPLPPILHSLNGRKKGQFLESVVFLVKLQRTVLNTCTSTSQQALIFPIELQKERQARESQERLRNSQDVNFQMYLEVRSTVRSQLPLHICCSRLFIPIFC